MKTILLIILTGLFSFSVSGQGNKISDIREKVQFINTDTSYVKVTLENNDFLEEMTDGGGQLIGFFKGETISKITERIGLSYAKYSTEYYFWKGQLIFALEKEETFPYVDSLATLDYTKAEKTFESCYYFDQEKLISTKTKGQKRIPDNLADPKAKEEKLLASAKAKMNILREKKP